MWSIIANKGLDMLRVIRPEAGEEIHQNFFDLLRAFKPEGRSASLPVVEVFDLSNPEA